MFDILGRNIKHLIIDVYNVDTKCYFNAEVII